MKNIIKYIFILVLGVVLFVSCEEDPITISEKIVGFDGTSGSIGEPSATPIAIPVFNAAASGTGSTVSFSLSTEGIDNPAIEGVDFTILNSSNSFSFGNSYATDTIFIQPIDNGIYDQDKSVKIILSEPTNGYELTLESSYTLTIVDDEHPLATWIGDYTADAASFLNPGVWDEVWSVTTTPNPDDPSQLYLDGIAFSSETVIANLDPTNMTISIIAGTSLGDPYDWTDVIINGFDGSSSIITSGAIVGTLETDGTFSFPYLAISNAADPGDVWDIFMPTFTKNKTE